MSTQLHSDEDLLTTDAIPSAPRDEVNNKQSDENVEKEDINNRTQPRVTNSNKKPKSKGFTKTRKTSPTAFASVINISNANGIHIGSNYNVYMNKTEDKQRNPPPTVTDAIKFLFNNNDPVTRKDLLTISHHLNEQWRAVGRFLDYSDGQISQFYEDYIRSGIKEVIYQLLLDWIQNESDNATVGKLSKALWDNDQYDAVTKWSEVYKNNKKQN